MGEQSGPAGRWPRAVVTAVGIADLITAVLASVRGLTLIRYDAGFEMAAQILDFEHRWTTRRGTSGEGHVVAWTRDTPLVSPNPQPARTRAGVTDM